jgi:hypothetical protein
MSRLAYAYIPFGVYFFAAILSIMYQLQSGLSNALSGSFSTPIQGSTGSLSFGGLVNFGLTLAGLMGFAVAIIVVALVLSIKVLGSGLGDSVPPIVSTVIVWIAPFVVVAGLGAPVIGSIPYFGLLINMILIGMYTYAMADHFGYPI